MRTDAVLRPLLALLCVLSAVRFDALASAANTAATTKISPEQLDSLVAPIALYPDPLLAQTLAACTYPLEIVQLQQWLGKNPGLKDQALLDAVAKQPWDPSIQAMAALPDVVKRLADDIQWTTQLGNAFLAQQGDVMDAVQRMRRKAQDAGHLQSNKQQKVETQVIESKSVIVIEQSNPQVVYVPAYNPVVVYGPPIYPYPPIYYPPPYYAGGMAISFGVGVAMGAFWSGGWGWGCGWGHSNININVQNNFHRVGHHNTGRGNSWQHNPKHRGGTPYADRATADRFGGTARGRSSATGSRAGATERIGTQDLSRSGSGNRGAFGGDTRGYNGPQAQAASTRGAQSMASRGSMSRGGGRRR